jgi:hypothetical protein
MSLRSMFSPKSSAALALAAFVTVFYPIQAGAALGEPELSVSADVQMLNATVKSIQRTAYRVHEIVLPSGTLLREFAAPGGEVFAVAWKGPALPDLRQALGRYFDAYTGAQRAKRGGRGQTEYSDSGLVVQSNGHMRAFSGRAYLSQEIPAGTSLDELR